MSDSERRVAVITGITGQDGSYLAEYLAARGVKVIGTTRHLGAFLERFPGDTSAVTEIVQWDMLDGSRFEAILDEYRPTEVYNFGAFSSGQFMDLDPVAVVEINGVAVVKMLEAIRQSAVPIRFCQASSSEVFAGNRISPQSETTPRIPRSIYGAAKILADNAVALYRDKFGVFCCSAFLFNHESPRRGEGFVTKKIARSAARIRAGLEDKLVLGDLSAARDWGYAGDYVRAMALMLRSEEPADFVVASGVRHTVADFCTLAFAKVSLDYLDYVQIDQSFVRAPEAVAIVGDASRAREVMGWKPTVTFEGLVGMMVAHEQAALAVR